MAMGSKFGPTPQSMKESGKLTKLTVSVSLYTLTEISTRVSGAMTRLMVMEVTPMPTALLTLVTGSMITSMARALRHGQTVQSTMDNTLRARNTGAVL